MNEMEMWSYTPRGPVYEEMFVERRVNGEGGLTYIEINEESVNLSREWTASLVEYLQKVLEYESPRENGWYLIMDSGLRSFALRYHDGAWINSSDVEMTLLDGSFEVVKKIGEL